MLMVVCKLSHCNRLSRLPIGDLNRIFGYGALQLLHFWPISDKESNLTAQEVPQVGFALRFMASNRFGSMDERKKIFWKLHKKNREHELILSSFDNGLLSLMLATTSLG